MNDSPFRAGQIFIETSPNVRAEDRRKIKLIENQGNQWTFEYLSKDSATYHGVDTDGNRVRGGLISETDLSTAYEAVTEDT